MCGLRVTVLCRGCFSGAVAFMFRRVAKFVRLKRQESAEDRQSAEAEFFGVVDQELHKVGVVVSLFFRRWSCWNLLFFFCSRG